MKTVQKSAAEMKDEASKKIQETKEQLFSKKDEEAPDQGPAVIQAGPHIKTEEDITAFVTFPESFARCQLAQQLTPWTFEKYKG